MLNLLFISDNPKVEYAKSVLQPVLKLIVDVALDFDYGLKEVLDKRPSIICVQDRIGGVTGESVARHIRMLLGASAPMCILLHTGSGEARTVKGLFEHFVDLNQPDDAFADEIENTLKLLLEDRWEKICVPPTPASAPTQSSDAGLEEPREDADTCADDSLFNSFGIMSPISPPETSPGTPPSARSGAVTPEKAGTTAPLTHVTPPSPSPASEFRINHNFLPADTDIPEDLPVPQKYRSESLLLRRTVMSMALVCFVCAAGGWYLVGQKTRTIYSLKRQEMSSSGAKQAPKTDSALDTPIPPSGTQPVVAPLLPAFIRQNAHDTAYAARKPGWERYVGSRTDFRIFSVSGRIQAVQALAVKNTSVSESLITTILKEFTGSGDYQISSRSTKMGVCVENGRVHDKGEVMVYRKNGAVKAFVVSIK